MNGWVSGFWFLVSGSLRTRAVTRGRGNCSQSGSGHRFSEGKTNTEDFDSRLSPHRYRPQRISGGETEVFAICH